jgi:hypothetical protein
MSSSIFEVEIGSNADVGSSINKIEGLIARARAIHNRCCCLQKVQKLIFCLSTSSQSATCSIVVTTRSSIHFIGNSIHSQTIGYILINSLWKWVWF